ncbi:hypothetical protein NDU88_002940 [Pleurodeles waltl]|uniref:Uncharacterized protein n=1 Tax=Pleurodeles waltl TaxID=8319 RepID=A0AAV7VCL0_PLEWA|nr:hypothetical protein NDU88_002940 [Pleurodeles waltl]
MAGSWAGQDHGLRLDLPAPVCLQLCLFRTWRTECQGSPEQQGPTEPHRHGAAEKFAAPQRTASARCGEQQAYLQQARRFTAREEATTRSKDWNLNQIRGLGGVEGQSQEEHDNDRPGNANKDDDEPPSEAKKWQRNTSRGMKKGDKRDASELPEAGVPGPSKRAKANNGEQISMIVQECLKSMAPLLFASPGGACEPKGSRGGGFQWGHSQQ